MSTEHTGNSVSYYKVEIHTPTTPGTPNYVAECNDIIEALGMNYAEANVFKAVWRICAARTLNKHKTGNTAVYDAEKSLFFAARILLQQQKLAIYNGESNEEVNTSRKQKEKPIEYLD